MIAFTCCHCQVSLTVNDDLAGTRVRCSQCRQVVDVPRTATAQSRSRANNLDDATLPPAPRSASIAADEATLPPRSPSHAVTLTYRAADHNAPERPVGEIVKAGSAYQLETEIARGGMGAVMRALDQDIRREVAVKFLLNQSDERQRTRFIEEAQITGQLEHPNIVPIHQLGVHEDGRCFFSMKMVKGRSLAEMLKSQGEPGASATGGEFKLSRLLNIFSNICNALGYAHSRNVIHRDLKPANIMVGDFGEVYVMDWGLAKVLGQESGGRSQESGAKRSGEERAYLKPPSSKVATSRTADSNLTQAGAIMGTPAYMPPEQAMGATVDERSDIYSLGAILYEMLTLSPPVGRGGDAIAILMRVAEGEIAPPETQAPERVRQGWIPPELSAIALKALAKKPDARYQSVEALQRDVQLFLEGRSVSAKQDSAWEMLRKLVRRNRGVSAAVAAALVVLALGAGLAFYFVDQERQGAVAARDKAEENYSAFLKEQDEKKRRGKQSAPAFLRAARLLMHEQQFADALSQVNVALEFDPALNEGQLLKGQLLIGLERFKEAAAPLAEYVKRMPDDVWARRLGDLAGRTAPADGAYYWELWDVFSKQKVQPLAEHMTRLVERLNQPKTVLLETYRKRIESFPGWAGRSGRLNLDKNGLLHLDLSNMGKVDLTPLKEMQLSLLNLSHTSVGDLGPLEGMPLVGLWLAGCGGVKDLSPLKGMKLTFISLHSAGDFTTLEPLRGMPLTWLGMDFCKVTDLEPLRKMPLREFYFISYGDTKIATIEPLTGMKLKKLSLTGARLVKDISPLRDMPLEHLDIGRTNVRDLEPLRGRPLKELTLSECPIHDRDLEVLRGMPLKSLNLEACGNIQDLAPLKDLPLTNLSLAGTVARDLAPLAKIKLTSLDLHNCAHISDCAVLKGMPLTVLSIAGCPQIASLDFARGMKLQDLQMGDTGISDLTPLKNMELRTISFTPRNIRSGMEIVRGMKSLDSVAAHGKGRFAPKDFWKLYDKGEFR